MKSRPVVSLRFTSNATSSGVVFDGVEEERLGRGRREWRWGLGTAGLQEFVGGGGAAALASHAGPDFKISGHG